LDVRFPLPHAGIWGARFVPTFDKSRQDVALMWYHGNAVTPLEIQGVFTLEDAFNKFWSARQVRVGDESEPYLKHPYEPALGVAWRGRGPGFTARAKWLTPSTKHFDTHDPALVRDEKLWGAKGDGTLSQRFGNSTAEVAFETIQASSYAYWEQQPGDHHVYR